MGCTTSTAVDETDPQYLQKMQNSQLEMLLMQSQQKEKNQVKLLLLGAGESGKSTVLKQMKLLHKGGFSHQERLQYCNIIWADTVALMQTLIIQARKLDIPLECDDPNSELHQFKRNVLNYKPLSNIDASSAGGVSFLKNYVMKYNEAVATKRQMRSTGKADAGWDHDSSSANLLKNGGSTTDVGENSYSIEDDGDNTVNEEESELDENLQDLKGLIGEESKNTAKTCSKLEIADSIKKLWEEDPGIMRCFQKSNQFQFEDSAPYFFDNVHSYARDDYLCSDDDILKGRIKTTGITETNFNIDGIKFKILDAGGQRSERKKWIHCFQDITCALFVLAVSEYDQMLFEDERVNRMHEAIMLFESLCNSKWFANTPFILFLNKVDLLEDKVRKSPLRKYFPDFKGKSNDAEDALQYFENLFLSLNRLNKPIYVHRTCATDTESMKFVLTAVTDMIIQQNLKKSGLI